MRILIVEDEASIARGLQFNFEREGFQVDLAEDGPTALGIFRDSDPPVDLIVLDLMLPGMSGYEICKTIRAEDESLPIIVLSARQSSRDKAHAFDCGADQYMMKPFELGELLSRVRNLLKRSELRPGHQSAGVEEGGDAPDDEKSTTSEGIYRFARFVVDARRFQVTVGDTVHSLTTKEMQLLKYFIEHEGIVLSRAQIIDEVWGQNPDITTRSIDNFVMRLRRLVEKRPSKPHYILSVRGTGYRFVGDA